MAFWLQVFVIFVKFCQQFCRWVSENHKIWKIRKISFPEIFVVHNGTAWLDNDRKAIEHVRCAFSSRSQSNQVSCGSEWCTWTMNIGWYLEEKKDFYCTSIVCEQKNDWKSSKLNSKNVKHKSTWHRGHMKCKSW